MTGHVLAGYRAKNHRHRVAALFLATAVIASGCLRGEASGDTQEVPVTATVPVATTATTVITPTTNSSIPPESTGGTSTTDATTTTAEMTTSVAPTTVAPTTTTGAPATAPVSAEPPPPEQPGTVLVTRIIDGDTVEIEGGARVRLIGIDTPERGECGFREANDHLAALILSRRVVLVAGARQDVDRYDRLLRYIDLDGRDINLAMIADGFAIARYDSRDGYGRHTREDAYIAADANSAPAIAC